MSPPLIWHVSIYTSSMFGNQSSMPPKNPSDILWGWLKKYVLFRLHCDVATNLIMQMLAAGLHEPSVRKNSPSSFDSICYLFCFHGNNLACMHELFFLPSSSLCIAWLLANGSIITKTELHSQSCRMVLPDSRQHRSCAQTPPATIGTFP
jgi:hypothetical protein